MGTKLSERTMKDICVCENPSCGEPELKHFETCPNCGSEAYHLTIKSYEEEEEGVVGIKPQ